MDKTKAEVAQANEAYQDAKKIFSIDGTPAAKTELEKVKANLAKKQEAELQARIKVAQIGDYLPKENERHLFHVEIDTPTFDPKTGKKLSKPFTQIFSIPEMSMFEKHGPTQGYVFEVLWNPIEFESK